MSGLVEESDRVIDSSVLVLGLVDGVVGDHLVTGYPGAKFHAPEHVDLEVLNALRKSLLRGVHDPESAGAAVRSLSRFPLRRHGYELLLDRIWKMRDNITPYDASFVALAQALGIPLLTADKRLAKAAARYCEVEVLG